MQLCTRDVSLSQYLPGPLPNRVYASGVTVRYPHPIESPYVGRVFTESLYHVIDPGAWHPLSPSDLASIQQFDSSGIIQQMHVTRIDFSPLQANVLPDRPTLWRKAFHALLLLRPGLCSEDAIVLGRRKGVFRRPVSAVLYPDDRCLR